MGSPTSASSSTGYRHPTASPCEGEGWGGLHMNRLRIKALAGILLCAGAVIAVAGTGPGGKKAAESISFKKTEIDREFRSEGVAVADVNHDGKPDILAGSMG